MAKKSAPKKKASPAKTKTAKPVKKAKPVKAAKPAPKAKPAAKPVKPAKPVKAEKPVKALKPALMTKKGKEAVVEPAEIPEVKRTKSVVSIIEAEPSSDDPSKVEKVSKAKPVKVDRGNLADEKAKWTELNKKFGRDKAITYKMTESYTSLIPLQHKVLGWGFVLTNENDRLEVLFENGIRMLISNYKS